MMTAPCFDVVHKPKLIFQNFLLTTSGRGQIVPAYIATLMRLLSQPFAWLRPYTLKEKDWAPVDA